MPPPKSRSWNEVLDNLGENLIRLGTSLSALSEHPTTPPNDAGFAQSTERIATGFRLAFRQARPALSSGQKVFLQLTRASVEELATAQTVGGTEHASRAHTLVHEGILVCQEMVTLLNQVEQASQAEPESLRRTLIPSLPRLAEMTASAGWELRTVCHEYDSEVRLAESNGVSIKDLVPASMGLLHDMAVAAQGLREARREWFRVGQRLASAVGVEARPADSGVEGS